MWYAYFEKSPLVDKKGNRIGSGIFYTYMYLLINTFITYVCTMLSLYVGFKLYLRFYFSPVSMAFRMERIINLQPHMLRLSIFQIGGEFD